MADKDAASSRRDFLRLASLGAAATGVAAATGAEAAAPEAPSGAAGYRETPHVRAYLESCRF